VSVVPLAKHPRFRIGSGTSVTRRYENGPYGKSAEVSPQSSPSRWERARESASIAAARTFPEGFLDDAGRYVITCLGQRGETVPAVVLWGCVMRMGNRRDDMAAVAVRNRGSPAMGVESVPRRRLQEPEPMKGDTLPDDLQAIFGQNLRMARLRSNKTLMEVAEAAGLSFQYVSKIETGQKNLTLDTMKKLAKVVDHDVSDLLRKPEG